VEVVAALRILPGLRKRAPGRSLEAAVRLRK